MVTMANITVRGDKEAAMRIAWLFEEISKRADVPLERSLRLLQDYVAHYPSESAGNRPAFGNSGPYYIRGTGRAYLRQDGQVSIYGGSEQLGASWELRTTRRGGEVSGVTRPTASYGPYVHDEDEQAPFHAIRGWRTNQQGIRDKRRDVFDIFARHVEKVAREF